MTFTLQIRKLRLGDMTKVTQVVGAKIHMPLLWTACYASLPPNSYTEVLTPSVMVLGGRSCGRRLSLDKVMQAELSRCD